MSIFKMIGEALDSLFEVKGRDSESPKAPNDVLERGAEMAVALFEGEPDNFVENVMGDMWTHPLGVRFMYFLGDWSLTLNGVEVRLSSALRKRLTAACRGQKKAREVASVQALAEAIVARGAA